MSKGDKTKDASSEQNVKQDAQNAKGNFKDFISIKADKIVDRSKDVFQSSKKSAINAKNNITQSSKFQKISNNPALNKGVKVVKKSSSKAKRLANKVTDSKAFKIANSKASSRLLSVGLSALGISLGVMALSGVGFGVAASFVAAPQIAIPLAVASITAVAIGAAVDTYMVRKTRLLHKENKYLQRHDQAKSIQNDILEKNPNIAASLADELYTPQKSNEKSVNERYTSEKKSKKESAAKIFLFSALNVVIKYTVAMVEAVVARNPLKVLKITAFGLLGLASEGSKQLSMSDKRNEFMENIDAFRAKDDSPGYDDLNELRSSSRLQKIQALALKKLSEDQYIGEYSKEQIKEKYQQIKQEIEAKEKSIKQKNSFLGIINDFIKAHNPFSKYQDPNVLADKLIDQDLQPLQIQNREEHREEKSEFKEVIKELKNKTKQFTYDQKIQDKATDKKISFVERLNQERGVKDKENTIDLKNNKHTKRLKNSEKQKVKALSKI